MQYSELAHVLRASAEISKENSFVLLGSQAILLLIDKPPPEILGSTEIDLYPANRPEKAEWIDGAIGALSQFHDTFGYHADGVSPETASLPADWMSRSVFKYFGEITAIAPDLHDLLASKCAAGRDKDADFVRALLQTGDAQISILLDRIMKLDSIKHDLESIKHWALRRAHEVRP